MSSMEFQVDPSNQSSSGVRSPVMAADSFCFQVSTRTVEKASILYIFDYESNGIGGMNPHQVKVYPNGGPNKEGKGVGVFINFTEKKGELAEPAVYCVHKLVSLPGSSIDFPLGSDMEFEIELVNLIHPRKSVVKSCTQMVYPGFNRGWNDFAKISDLTKEIGWLDQEDKLVFRARANVVEKDPNPLKPEWHEVRFDGRQEYDPGDEFKSPPTWKGNYKFQLAVFPGGLEDTERKRSFAAYIHLLGKSDTFLSDSLGLKIVLLNHEDPSKTIKWFCTHTFNDGEKQSWGCPHLLDLEQLYQQEQGWLNEFGEIILRASVQAATVEGSNPAEMVAASKNTV
ncbi:hypothetical protein FOZ62_002917 [Perkinsus olseni]|uniref:MATH domain-containing protein n=1 Tax=Perkinsus olseni TaxID=32597 RepID=A0A7J6T3H6_PEROL|nr:hypothetical protein FOZ62_002917 [Perkinsus olseni]